MPAEPSQPEGPVDTAGTHDPELTQDTQERLEAETATANGIYGLIVSSAVMASVHGQTVLRLALAALVTLVIYWTAERYAHVMAHRIVDPSLLSWSLLRRELRHEFHRGWELVTASFLPLGVLLGSKVLGASVTEAVLAALVCATVLLAAAGWQVGREADLSPLWRLLSAVCAGAFGAAMILLKALLH